MSAFHWKNAANGSFNTASAWIPSGVPGATDIAVIDAVGTYTLKNDGFGGTLISDPPPAANPHVRSASLLGSYIASSIVAAPSALGGSPIAALTAAETPLLAHPVP